MADPQQQLVLNFNHYGTLENFDPSTTSLESWLQLFEEYATANALPRQSTTWCRIINAVPYLFPSSMGELTKLFLQACLPLRPNQKTIPELSDILRRKFEPAGMVTANRYTFSTRNQQDWSSPIIFHVSSI